jgi:hypothetical protein
VKHLLFSDTKVAYHATILYLEVLLFNKVSYMSYYVATNDVPIKVNRQSSTLICNTLLNKLHNMTGNS